MASFFGSIKKLVSLVFKEDGQDISVEPNTGTPYTGTTLYELPPKAAGTEILVGQTATQTLSNKTLQVPLFSGGAIDIPAGSTIGGSAIGSSGGGASTSANNTWTGTNTFSARFNVASTDSQSSIDLTASPASTVIYPGSISTDSLSISNAANIAGNAVLDTSTGARLAYPNVFTGGNTFSGNAPFEVNTGANTSSSILLSGSLGQSTFITGNQVSAPAVSSATTMQQGAGLNPVLDSSTGARLVSPNTFTDTNIFSGAVTINGQLSLSSIGTHSLGGDIGSVINFGSGNFATSLSAGSILQNGNPVLDTSTGAQLNQSQTLQGENTFSAKTTFSGAVIMPSNTGVTTPGSMQYNPTTNQMEYYNGTIWVSF